MIKILTIIITFIFYISNTAIAENWDENIKKIDSINDHQPEHASIDELRSLYKSNNKGDYFMFIHYLEKYVAKYLIGNTHDKELENLLYDGLNDTRSGFIHEEDIGYISPRAVCGIYLARITNYDEYLKRTLDEKYSDPEISTAFDEITGVKQLKLWYETIYLTDILPLKINNHHIRKELPNINSEITINSEDKIKNKKSKKYDLIIIFILAG